MHVAVARGPPVPEPPGVFDAVDAAQLRLTPGGPLIVVDSTDVTVDGRPILTTRARLAADRIELVIET